MHRTHLSPPFPPAASVVLPAVPSLLATALAFVAAVLVLLGSVTAAQAQSGTEFPELQAGQRVVDQTGTSLTADEVTDLEGRLDDLVGVGADGVAYVRALDASPEETLEQVEALQQAWVALTGADEDTAVALLINRNPDDPEDARAGVFVGRTFEDGNVPEGEQRDIVDDALIPPLRDGDVHGSLAAAVDRLRTSVVDGPPVSEAEVWAAGAATSWLLWACLGAAMVLILLAWSLYRRRQTLPATSHTPTTTRPGDLPPALFAALVVGGPQGTAVPATLLDMATRGAVSIEQEGEGGRFTGPSVQIRLIDRAAVQGTIEEALWASLQEEAEAGLVSSKAMQKVVGAPAPVRKTVEAQMGEAGWLDPGAQRPRAGLLTIALIGGLLAFGAFLITAIGGEPWPGLLGALALGAVPVAAGVMYAGYSRLSMEGQRAAVPWQAYREGLAQAAKDDTMGLDLDAVLPDVVALGLESSMDDRLTALSESGRTLRAFSGTTRPGDVAAGTFFPYWVAFQSTAGTSSSGAGSTVSGGGAGGGGGAAGST